MKKEIRVITSKESKSGAELIYIDGVKYSRKNAEYLYWNYCDNKDASEIIYIWGVGFDNWEIEEMVAAAKLEMDTTYSAKVEEVEVENEVEEIATAEVTISAATFETVEVEEVQNTCDTGIKIYKVGGVEVKISKINNFKIYGVNFKFGNFNSIGGVCIRGSPRRQYLKTFEGVK